ncbi:ankyrin repeat protein [Colletotrichum plurivorum]|uniref:Ankyrin repeat protein n=1 Tax=Colletotrichum plurivorum TaxID=2175906 RepID=A0A8H6JH02_9PEZI|nr:ankyrin repeat protein [Colletotrichum plurivorum]
MNHRLDRLWIILAMLLGLAHADTLDDFTNNLVSDLSPILALFGERVTMQFMSQSLDWVDCVVLAMVPLGITTIIVSAIRVGGPVWLKAIIGRATENRSAAEMEVMSSTSREVCEMFNGQGIVRCQGSAPVWEYVCLVPLKQSLKRSGEGLTGVEDLSDGEINFKTLEEAVKEKLLNSEKDRKPRDEGSASEHKQSRGIRQILSLFRHHREGNYVGSLYSSEEGPSTPQLPGDHHCKNIIVIRNAVPHAPNISLNLSDHYNRTPVRAAAVIGTILQLGVLVFFAVITYHPRIRLDFKKDNSPVPDYACPLAAGGTVLVVAGMFLCAHVVESSTTETRYTVNRNGNHIMRLFWIQREQVVSDQVFESFAMHPASRCISFIASHRNAEKAQTGGGSLQAKTIFGTTIGLAGFICQFIGLRQMNSAASLAQLIVVCIMTAARALVRRGFEGSFRHHKLLPGFKLDWFAWKLLQMRPVDHCQSTTGKWSGPPKAQHEAVKSHKAPGRWIIDNCWTEHRGPQEFQICEETTPTGTSGQEAPFQKDAFHEIPTQPSPTRARLRENSRSLMRARRKLSDLANYKAKLRIPEVSLKLAAAMEKTLDLFSPHFKEQHVDLIWQVGVHCNELPPQESQFQIMLHYDSHHGSWKVRANELNAVLTLWTYTIKASELDDATGQDMRDFENVQTDNDDWSDHPRSVRILGRVPNLKHGGASVTQDISLWALAAWSRTLKLLHGDLLKLSTEGFAQSGRVRFMTSSNPLKWQENRELQRALKPADYLTYRRDATWWREQYNAMYEQHYWAVQGGDSLELRCAKELLFFFVCSTSISMKRRFNGKVDIRPVNAASNDLGVLPTNPRINSFGNDELSSLINDFVQLGFGFEDEASLSVLLPLSMRDKLPLPWAIFDSLCMQVTQYREMHDWFALRPLFTQMTNFCVQGGSNRAIYQHGFAFLVESIHDVESELWQRRTEGRVYDGKRRGVNAHRQTLTWALRTFPDHEKLLGNLADIYSWPGGDKCLLANLQGSSPYSIYDDERLDVYASGDSIDKEGEGPGNKRNAKSVRSKSTPKWGLESMS